MFHHLTRLPMLFVFLSVSNEGICSQVAEGGWHQRITAARDLQRHGDISGAMREVQAALSDSDSTGLETADQASLLAMAGVFFQDLGSFAQAEKYLKRSLKIWTRLTGPNDPKLAPVVSQLAWLYAETGRSADAKRLNLPFWIDLLSAADPHSKYIPALLECWGTILSLEKRYGAAEAVFHQALDRFVKRGSARSSDMGSVLNNLGLVYERAGDYGQAAASLLKALEIVKSTTDPEGLEAAIVMKSLARVDMRLGLYGDSDALFKRALVIIGQRCGPSSLRTAEVLTAYAQLLRNQHRSGEAKLFEIRAQQIRSESIGELHIGQTVDVTDLATKTRKP